MFIIRSSRDNLYIPTHLELRQNSHKVWSKKYKNKKTFFFVNKQDLLTWIIKINTHQLLHNTCTQYNGKCSSLNRWLHIIQKAINEHFYMLAGVYENMFPLFEIFRTFLLRAYLKKCNQISLHFCNNCTLSQRVFFCFEDNTFSQKYNLHQKHLKSKKFPASR